MTTFVISTIAFLLIGITMFVRAADQQIRRGVRWHARLIGFVVVFGMCMFIPYDEWTRNSYPTWLEVLFRVGLCAVFMTTPGHKPWHQWLFNGDDT